VAALELVGERTHRRDEPAIAKESSRIERTTDRWRSRAVSSTESALSSRPVAASSATASSIIAMPDIV
jgi:hypothetical protein